MKVVIYSKSGPLNTDLDSLIENGSFLKKIMITKENTNSGALDNFLFNILPVIRKDLESNTSEDSVSDSVLLAFEDFSNDEIESLYNHFPFTGIDTISLINVNINNDIVVGLYKIIKQGFLVSLDLSQSTIEPYHLKILTHSLRNSDVSDFEAFIDHDYEEFIEVINKYWAPNYNLNKICVNFNRDAMNEYDKLLYTFISLHSVANRNKAVMNTVIDSIVSIFEDGVEPGEVPLDHLSFYSLFNTPRIMHELKAKNFDFLSKDFQQPLNDFIINNIFHMLGICKSTEGSYFDKIGPNIEDHIKGFIDFKEITGLDPEILYINSLLGLNQIKSLSMEETYETITEQMKIEEAIRAINFDQDEA